MPDSKEASEVVPFGKRRDWIHGIAKREPDEAQALNESKVMETLGKAARVASLVIGRRAAKG